MPATIRHASPDARRVWISAYQATFRETYDNVAARRAAWEALSRDFTRVDGGWWRLPVLPDLPEPPS